MIITRAKAQKLQEAQLTFPSTLEKNSRHGAFGGKQVPNEIFMLILDILPLEDRASLSVVCAQLRPLALITLDKLKLMRDVTCLSLPLPRIISHDLTRD